MKERKQFSRVKFRFVFEANIFKIATKILVVSHYSKHHEQRKKISSFLSIVTVDSFKCCIKYLKKNIMCALAFSLNQEHSIVLHKLFSASYLFFPIPKDLISSIFLTLSLWSNMNFVS